MNRISALLSVFSFVLFALASPANAALPTCNSASSDSDGDGYGWENNSSCKVETASTKQSPACASSASDPDGDGYGWENNASCIVTDTRLLQDDPTGSMPECMYTASDADGDGYGWENAASCLVTRQYPNHRLFKQRRKWLI